MEKPADIWTPALIAGAVFGLLSGTPFVGALNCACCSLVVGAGVMATFMVVRASGTPVSWGRGALVGLIAGTFTAIFSTLVSVLFILMQGKGITGHIEEAADQAAQIAPSMQEAARVAVGLGAPFILALMLIVELCLYAPFGALGGVLGRAIFEKRAAPPAPSSPPPPEPPGSPGPMLTP